MAAYAFDAQSYSNSTQQEQYRIAATRYCEVGSILVRNIGATTVNVLVIDTNAAPASGAITVIPAVTIAQGQTASIVFPGGRFFSRGCVVAVSTNEVGYGGTYTSAWFDVTYSYK